MISSSWVIVEKDTKKAVMETYNKEILKYLKPAFEAVPVYDYLVNLNKEIKLGRKYQ